MRNFIRRTCVIFLGANESDLDRLEMVSLLCMSDRTHSQLMELLPEKCGAPQNKDFDAILAQVFVPACLLKLERTTIKLIFWNYLTLFSPSPLGRRLQGSQFWSKWIYAAGNVCTESCCLGTIIWPRIRITAGCTSKRLSNFNGSVYSIVRDYSIYLSVLFFEHPILKLK